MKQGEKRKKAAFVIVLLMVLAVATTRGVTLMHNSYLHPGEMVITCSEDHSRCNRYIIPYEDDAVHELIFNWETFKHINTPYYIGQVYPEYYYYLFGFWIKGTTGTDYEFPTNQVYYRAE